MYANFLKSCSSRIWTISVQCCRRDASRRVLHDELVLGHRIVASKKLSSISFPFFTCFILATRTRCSRKCLSARKRFRSCHGLFFWTNRCTRYDWKQDNLQWDGYESSESSRDRDRIFPTQGWEPSEAHATVDIGKWFRAVILEEKNCKKLEKLTQTAWIRSENSAVTPTVC